jgi:hypothetical protein
MPFKEVVGNAASDTPEQIAATGVKVGVVFGITVMVSEVFMAHCPASGVKVYVVVAVLFRAGAQIPVMPFMEVVGSADNVSPAHIAAIAVNVGIVLLFTPMVIVAIEAHCPASGVNEYVVVIVLFIAGVHVPVMPFNEVVGRGLIVPPKQMAGTCVNVGVIFRFTVIVRVVVVAHCPAVGVKV